MLPVSRSGYDAWRDRPPSAQAHRRTAQVRQVFDASGGRYGSPNITAALRRAGEQITQKTVVRLVRAQPLRSRVVRQYKATTNSRHPYPVAENRLTQPVVADRPHAVGMGDITYVATDAGWLYWATSEALYTRPIVGWPMDARMTQDLLLRPLDQAVPRHQPPGGAAPF